jgi:hypothetical protein
MQMMGKVVQIIHGNIKDDDIDFEGLDKFLKYNFHLQIVK